MQWGKRRIFYADLICLHIDDIFFVAIVRHLPYPVISGNLEKDGYWQKDLIHFFYNHNIQQAITQTGSGSDRDIVSKLVAVGDTDKISVSFDDPVSQFYFEWIRF